MSIFFLHFAKQTKLKLDQDFKAWAHCGLGNVLCVRVCHSLSMCGVGGGIMEGECSDCVIGELSCSGDTCDSLGRSLRETNTQIHKDIQPYE